MPLHLQKFREKYLFVSVHHSQVLEFMLGFELLFKKPGKFAFAFIEVSLCYSATNRIVKRFAISVLPNTRSVAGPEALHQRAHCMVNLLGTAVQYTSD